MAIVYGKTTLPNLPTLRKLPDNVNFFTVVIYIVNISQLAIRLFHGWKDQWLHNSIDWRWKEGTFFAQFMHVISTVRWKLNSLFLLYRKLTH